MLRISFAAVDDIKNSLPIGWAAAGKTAYARGRLNAAGENIPGALAF